MAGVRKAEDFAAWQLADAFKSEVFALLKSSPGAMRDTRFRYQLKDSASGRTEHITEGFYRKSPLDFCRFLDYALGSLRVGERQVRTAESAYFEGTCLRDGVVCERCLRPR